MKKNLFRAVVATLVLAAIFSLASCGAKRKILNDGKTPVERYGALHLDGTKVCAEDGKGIQLCGMSSHGLHWYGKYANRDVMKWLRDDWNCDLWRSAMYIGGGGYAQTPALANKMIESIDAAIELGMYIIVDWHVLHRTRSAFVRGQSRRFFRTNRFDLCGLS